MATPNVYSPAPGGTVIVPVAVAASDTVGIQPTGRYVYVVANGGGSTDNVSIDDPNTTVPPGAAASATFADQVGGVGAGTTRAFPLDASRHRDSGTGLATITHSFTTTVTAWLLGPF